MKRSAHKQNAFSRSSKVLSRSTRASKLTTPLWKTPAGHSHFSPPPAVSEMGIRKVQQAPFDNRRATGDWGHCGRASQSTDNRHQSLFVLGLAEEHRIERYDIPVLQSDDPQIAGGLAAAVASVLDGDWRRTELPVGRNPGNCHSAVYRRRETRGIGGVTAV